MAGIEAHRVSVAGTDLEFEVPSGERILGAARRSGVWLPFECGWGTCGTCKATLIEGEVELLFQGAPSVDTRDARRKRALMCQSTPTTDLLIKVARLGEADERPTRDHVAELTSNEPLADGISRFTFHLEGIARYRPGQFAILELGNQVRRCYSMAGPPGSDQVQFIAKRYDGKVGSQRLFSLPQGTKIAMELPYGDMWLRPGQRPVVLTAGGTGVSAILALLHELAGNKDPRPVHVIYGADRVTDLVCWTELQHLVAELPHATLEAVLREPPDKWAGATGFVMEPLSKALESIGDADHYFAGPPVMVDSVSSLLTTSGVQLTQVHFDRFG